MKTTTEEFLKEKGIIMTDFISSSTYDAVVKMVDEFRKPVATTRTEWDGICRCGHKHSDHSEYGQNHNYSAGSCLHKGCNCKNFIHEPGAPEKI